MTATLRQVFPECADLTDTQVAAAYAYPETGVWVRAIMVSSLDGSAVLQGRSGGLSGPADEAVFALQRSLADVVLVGAGTVRAEGYQPVKPHEVARWAFAREGRSPTPPIAVVTSHIDLDLASPLLADAPPHARTIVITTEAAPAQRREAAARTTDVVVAGKDSVDIAAAVDALAERGLRRVVAEGGPHLLDQLAGVGLMHELCLTLSPLLAGPGGGRILQRDTARAAPTPMHPDRMSLANVLIDDGFLLCRYLRGEPDVKSSQRSALVH